MTAEEWAILGDRCVVVLCCVLIVVYAVVQP